MSFRWNRPTERGYEQDRPLQDGPSGSTGPDGAWRAGTRPEGGQRLAPARRARIRAS